MGWSHIAVELIMGLSHISDDLFMGWSHIAGYLFMGLSRIADDLFMGWSHKTYDYLSAGRTYLMDHL